MAMWENSSQMWENPNVGKSVKIVGKLWENCGKLWEKDANVGKYVGILAPVFAKHVGKLRECDSIHEFRKPFVSFKVDETLNPPAE